MLNRFVTLPCTVNCVEPRGSKIEPHVCLHIILRNPEARFVQTAKVYLGLSMTLFGSLAKPLRRLSVVLWHAQAPIIHEREVVLAHSRTLIGSLPKPFQRLGIVLRHPFPIDVHDSESDLGLGITSIGSFLDCRAFTSPIAIANGSKVIQGLRL